MTEPEADRMEELEQDNRRLRHLLDQRDAPGELRHRLRSTVALLRAILRRSADTARDLPSYVAHLEDRLDAIARAQGLADQHGTVELRTLIADELLHYGASEGETLFVSGPDVCFQPKAGQVLALAIHELAVNAVEHGVLGSANGRVSVTWTVAETDAAPLLTLIWAELGTDREPPLELTGANEGFGTEVLTRMLAYDLQAETEIGFRRGTARCTVRVPLPPTVGRVSPNRSGVWTGCSSGAGVPFSVLD